LTDGGFAETTVLFCNRNLDLDQSFKLLISELFDRAGQVLRQDVP
jgi:hypothetical protein